LGVVSTIPRANHPFPWDAAHTTQWHFDFQENFTIHLSGRKTWKLHQGIAATRYPTQACTPQYAAPEVVESQLKAVTTTTFQFGNPCAVGTKTNAKGEVREVALDVGDFLYVPTGMWHHVTTIEPGVSINVSLMATNYASVTCQALQHLLLQCGDEGWRETIHQGSRSNHHVDVVQKLLGLLEKLPQIIQDFSKTNDATAIIPPILRKAPSFQVERHGNDWRNVDEDDGDEVDNHHDGGSNSGDDGTDEDDGIQVDEGTDQQMLGT
jgi:Cupin superfamily protein